MRLVSSIGCVLLLFSGSVIGSPPQAALSPAQVVFEGFYDVRPNGPDTTWMGGLTHRYVGDDLRFLGVTHKGILLEFSLAGRPLNSTEPSEVTTGAWDLSGTGALGDHKGIWFEQDRNRLWVTSSPDYSNVYTPARVTLIALGPGGAVQVLKRFFLDEIPAKRAFGGCNSIPSSLRSALGGVYVCGWGGYTSLVAQGGGASIGPTMYAIPDPDTVADGGVVRARTILDAAETRGVRKTIPVNYFDGGDPRPNGQCPECNGHRPTSPPARGADWLSPNSDGLGWMVWGDSYHNTGTWIGESFVAVASLAKGYAWYCASTLCWDDRQYELHVWSGSRLSQGDRLARPDSMTELILPRGENPGLRGPDAVAGATYDPVSGRLYLITYTFGQERLAGRLYAFVVDEDAGPVGGPQMRRPFDGQATGRARPR